jgi:signal transduction histidine kinase
VGHLFSGNATKGIVAGNDTFSRLVTLACHDLRTPLATVFGFARTLSRSGTLDETSARYVDMIESASEQIGELLDELGVAARIEAGRYAPTPVEVDSLELAHGAAERLGEERVAVSGAGGRVLVDREATGRAVSALVQCALRHGGLDEVAVHADGSSLTVRPITPSSAPVVLGQDLRDLGAAVAVRVVEAQGGSVGVSDSVLLVSLPT